MTIQEGILTPGMYTDVNINTQRTGLPANTQKVLFITPDNGPAMPVSIYDKNDATTHFGTNSTAAHMIVAAVKTNRAVDVQCLGMSDPGSNNDAVCYNFSQTEIDNLQPVTYQYTKEFNSDALDEAPIETGHALTFRAYNSEISFFDDPTSIDDYFHIFVDGQMTSFAQLHLKSDFGYCNAQDDFSNDVEHIGGRAFLYLYNNTPGIKIIRLCSKQKTYFEESVWHPTNPNSQAGMSQYNNILRHVDENGFETLIFKIQNR